MGFFRSSESKSSKSKSRFSFRRHSDDAADAPPSKPLPPAPQHTRKLHSSTQSTPRPPTHPPQCSDPSSSSSSNTAVSVGLRGTIVSSASTSASSSITSPTAIQRAALEDADKITTASSKRTSDSLVSTDTDDSESIRTPSESSFLPTTPRESLDMGDHALPFETHNGGGARSQRHSLVGYRQLQCSMSYKNRMAQGASGEELLAGTPGGSSNSLRASFNTSGRRSETGSIRSTSSRKSRSSGNLHHSRESNSGPLGHIDELSTEMTTSASPPAPAPAPPLSSCSSSSSSSASSSSKSLIRDSRTTTTTDASDSSSLLLADRMTEASVAALQTRRAFQQMVLALEDDNDSSDYEYDSDSESFGGGGGGSFSRPSAASFASGGGVVQVGADDYRKFQFRLRQLEDLCHDQARKQVQMEDTIETEVASRTKKVVDAMEKKIAMYKQAKDLEVEREIQRRLSVEGRSSTAGAGAAAARESSFYGASSGQFPGLGSSPGAAAALDPSLKGKPLDKIFHPRRTRRRLEQIREREEQQKREMEEFRAFIRNTEMTIQPSTRAKANSFFNDTQRAASEVFGAETARESIKALGDPHITEDLLGATQNELIEMICVLRKHVSVQETQLDEAKRLISAAIEAREEAEETAREAVELTMELDTRLERASHEMIVIKDELRRSSDFSMRSSYLMSSIGPGELSASFYGASSSALPRSSSTSNLLPRVASSPS